MRCGRVTPTNIHYPSVVPAYDYRLPTLPALLGAELIRYLVRLTQSIAFLWNEKRPNFLEFVCLQTQELLTVKSGHLGISYTQRQ